MKTSTLVILLLFVYNIVSAQEKYFIKTDGTKVLMHPTKFDIHPSGIMLTDKKLEYFDAKGKGQAINQSEVKEMVVGSEYYSLLPINKKDNRLLRIIATNAEYILSIYDPLEEYSPSNSAETYLFVHHKQTRGLAEEKVAYYNVDIDYKGILPVIKKYFAACTELFSKMDNNSKTQEKEKKKYKRLGPFEEINNLTCQ
jgi:hypothetical protein